MKKRYRNIIFPTLLAALLIGAATSCNKKSEETEEINVTSSSVAIKDFYIQANSKVLSNLDSVFFSIDMENGVIFNADSIPVGTDVTRLIPMITFANSVTQADLVFKKDNETDTTVNYLTNPTDSIDFTYPVTLNVTAADETNTYTYILKVNVHEQEPDSLIWDKLAYTSLPAQLPKPKNQKTVAFKEEVYCMIEESNGSYTLSASDNLEDPDWTSTEISFGFSPDIRSLTATDDHLWLLSTEGELYESADGLIWTSAGEKWVSIIGPYNNGLLGLKYQDGDLWHCHYPYSENITDSKAASDFPITGRSSVGTVESDWYPMPTVFFVGGVTSNGTLSNATWAFDGSNWAKIDNISAPALESPTMFNYIAYRSSGKVFQQIAYQTWMIIGGTFADGTYNDLIYISPDNGVTWKVASASMQLPEYIPELMQADAWVMDSILSANLTDAWTETPTKSTDRWLKITYTIDDYEIYWNCPYIYLFGGIMPEGTLSDSIWKGVLARLQFTPVF